MTIDIERAIQHSINHDTISEVTVSSSAVEAIESGVADYHTDARQVEADRYEVWGWTDSTPEGEQDWRLLVTLAD